MKEKSMQTIFSDQDYLDAILENFQDGIYITDSEANTVYLNHAYELISGLVKTEMIGKNMKDLVAGGVVSVSGTLSVLETGESITIEQSFKTGKRAVITSSPIYGEAQGHNHIIMVVTVVREITEIYSIRREMQRLIAQNRQYVNEIERLNHEITGNVPMVAADNSSVRLLRLAERVSMVDAPVLISGEPGVGKEKLARFIHSHSKRNRFPFMRLDWSIMPKDDPVKYLFGYENAETNEYNIGVLESADGGTVYVDELTEMPLTVRDRFLALLRSGACIMGDGVMRRLRIRFIISSRYSYKELQDMQQMEPEILQCLSMFPMEILPLRQRQDDIIPLLDYFLNRYNQKTGEEKVFSKTCYKRLLSYAWPENVREVSIVVQRAAIISEGKMITESDLMLDDAVMPDKSAQAGIKRETETALFCVHRDCNDLKYEAARLEAYYMNLAFDRYKNIRDAAASLGIDSSTFVRKRQRYKKLGLMDGE